MSLLLEQSYTQRLSGRLDRFKRKSESIWVFRCPICGDSQVNKAKTRGYLYQKTGKMWFHCHNCNESLSFSNFLKRIDGALYREYVFDLMKDKNPSVVPVEKMPVIPRNVNLPKLSELPFGHPARVYCEKRKIPRDCWSLIYYADKFKDFIDDFVPNHGKHLGSEPRIILPFTNEEGETVGISGRDILGKSKQKYITIKVSEDAIKYYHKEKLNRDRPIYVFEGPLDSLHINNSVAVMDSNLTAIMRYLGTDLDYVFVPDNEPRNKVTVGNMEKIIDMECKIVIWPKYCDEKDVNEMVVSGHYSDIEHFLKDHTFSGFEAKLKMLEWRKS